MYLLSVAYRNAKLNGTGQLIWSRDRDCSAVPKWSLVDGGTCRLEQFRLCVAVCNSAAFWAPFRNDLARLHGNPRHPLQIEYQAVVHSPQDTGPDGSRIHTGGIGIDYGEVPKSLTRRQLQQKSSTGVFRNIHSRAKLMHFFLLAYGRRWRVHDGTDDFSFGDAALRRRHFHSLFSSTARLTDPVAFLSLLHHRGVKYERFGPLQILGRLTRLLESVFFVNASVWYDPDCNVAEQWMALAPELRVLLGPVLDACRHVLDAFPKSPEPLDQPGVILFDRPPGWDDETGVHAWMSFWDELFPNLQFIVSLAPAMVRTAPRRLLQKRLHLPLGTTRHDSAKAGTDPVETPGRVADRCR